MDDKKTQDATTTDASTKEDSGKTFTQDDVNVIVSKRIGEAEKNFDRKLKETIDAERRESERLAKLSADEKEIELTAKQKDVLEQKEKELATRENKLEAIRMLNDVQVSINMAQFLVSDDMNATTKNVETFIEGYKKAVSEGIANQLKGKAPSDFADNSKADKKKVKTTF